MNRQTAIDHFGSISALARALGISYEAVRQWGDVVPELRQYQLEKLTNGALKAEPETFPSAEVSDPIPFPDRRTQPDRRQQPERRDSHGRRSNDVSGY